MKGVDQKFELTRILLRAWLKLETGQFAGTECMVVIKIDGARERLGIPSIVG